MPLHYYFCREVATNATRSTLRQYALQTRRYLGPTSMDSEMAFIMCNQARVCKQQQHSGGQALILHDRSLHRA